MSSLTFEDDLMMPEYARVQPRDLSQEIPMLVIATVSSLLSMTGSGCIMYMTRMNLNQLLQRILFCMSLCDFGMSLGFLTFPWALPPDTGMNLAMGTFSSCKGIGFVMLLSATMGGFYSCSLALYYLASVRYNWKEQSSGQISLPTWEMAVHAVLVTITLSLIIAAAVTDVIKPMEAMPVCFLQSYPWGCETTKGLECDAKPEHVQIIFGIGALFQSLATITAIIATITVYITVRNKLKESDRFRAEDRIRESMDTATTTTNNNNNTNNKPNSFVERMSSLASRRREGEDGEHRKQSSFDKRIQQVRTQTILYTLTYLNTYFWPAVTMAITFSMTSEELQDIRDEPAYFTLQVLATIFCPAQGLFNFLIYTRLKVQRWKEIEPENSLFQIYRNIITGVPIPAARTSSSTTRRVANNQSKNNLCDTNNRAESDFAKQETIRPVMT